MTLAVRDLTLAAPVSAAATGGDGKVRAAMNGRVVAVLVKPGEKVAAGQPVMTLEAMKMEHVHTAGVAGTICGDRCRRRRAGDDGEDRGGDRGSRAGGVALVRHRDCAPSPMGRGLG